MRIILLLVCGFALAWLVPSQAVLAIGCPVAATVGFLIKDKFWVLAFVLAIGAFVGWLYLFWQLLQM